MTSGTPFAAPFMEQTVTGVALTDVLVPADYLTALLAGRFSERFGPTASPAATSDALIARLAIEQAHAGPGNRPVAAVGLEELFVAVDLPPAVLPHGPILQHLLERPQNCVEGFQKQLLGLLASS